MSEFTTEQLSVSTAEDEMNYFTDVTEESEHIVQPNLNAIFPPGTYRVIGGELYRIVGGVPPALPGE